MRPGSPIGIGTFENRPTFLLPGNPVACLYGYDFFAGRVIRKLTGRGIDLPYHQHQLPLGEALNSIEGRTDFVRVRIVGDSVIKSKQQGSSMLFSAVRSDGFIIIPERAVCTRLSESKLVVHQMSPIIIAISEGSTSKFSNACGSFAIESSRSG